MGSDWTQAVRGVHLLWFPIPAYSALPILMWVMHARLWTFVLALTVCAVLAILKTKGRTVAWVIRRLRSRMRAGTVFARPIWFRRRMQHLQSFDLVHLQPGSEHKN